MSIVTLRPWQRAAFDQYRSSPAPDFLAVATPGAGKTTYALACARATLADWADDGAAGGRRLVVVAPTSHLKIQWSVAAHRLGLQLDPDWSPRQGRTQLFPGYSQPLPPVEDEWQFTSFLLDQDGEW